MACPQPVTNPLSPDVIFLPISVSFHGKHTGEANDTYEISKVLSSRAYNKVKFLGCAQAALATPRLDLQFNKKVIFFNIVKK